MKYLRILMLAAGIALMGWGGVVLVRNYLRSAEVHGWPRAQGRITGSQVDTLQATEVGNAGDFYPHVRYDYVVGGRTYHGETLYLDERRSFDSSNVAARELVFLEVGTQTEVLYNPQNAREAALIVDKPTWRYFFLFVLGGLLAWFGWGFWRVRAGQQPMPQPQGQPQLPPGMQAQPQPMPQMQAQPQPKPQGQLQFSPGAPLAVTPGPEATTQG